MYKIILILLSLNLFANEQIGKLIFKNGLVKVQHLNSIRKKSLNLNNPIYQGDKISTYNSLATIELNDKSIIKLDKYSTIKFDKKFKQTAGRIYYKITKRKQQRLEIATNFTTIGVKGTTFIVDTNKTKMVALKKGLVSLTALKGKYELHKRKKLTEYEQYKLSINNSFGKYKKQLSKEFIEYKKTFDLPQQQIVIFDKNKAHQKDLNSSKYFPYFEKQFK